MVKTATVSGIHVEYSNVNQAWFVMWCEAILNICLSRAEALDYVRDYTS